MTVWLTRDLTLGVVEDTVAVHLSAPRYHRDSVGVVWVSDGETELLSRDAAMLEFKVIPDDERQVIRLTRFVKA